MRTAPHRHASHCHATEGYIDTRADERACCCSMHCHTKLWWQGNRHLVVPTGATAHPLDSALGYASLEALVATPAKVDVNMAAPRTASQPVPKREPSPDAAGPSGTQGAPTTPAAAMPPRPALELVPLPKQIGTLRRAWHKKYKNWVSAMAAMDPKLNAGTWFLGWTDKGYAGGTQQKCANAECCATGKSLGKSSPILYRCAFTRGEGMEYLVCTP